MKNNPLIELAVGGLKKSPSIKPGALAKFAELKYDPLTGFSGLYASQIASETLADVAEKDQRELFEEAFLIFEQWKKENGRPLILFGLGKVETEEERIKAISNKNAWECCAGVSTPAGLFWKLFVDDYKPLSNFIEKAPTNYERLLALLILASEKSTYIPGECIELGLKLAQYRLSHQKRLIKLIEPHATTAFHAQRNSKRVRQEQKSAIDRKVMAAHVALLEKDGKKPSQKALVAATELKQPTVSRAMGRLGLGRKKK